jgi:FG-GAP repeat
VLEVRRVATLGAVLVLVGTVWPTTQALAQESPAAPAPAAGSLRADFNQDGLADLAIGVAWEDVGAAGGAGAVHVLYGTADGLSGAGSQFLTQDSPEVRGSAESGDFFGSALAAGDFDHDGYADLAVAAPDEDVGGVVDAGAVNVLYGSAGGLTGVGSQYFTQDSRGVGSSAESGDFFGSALTAGDFDLDGSADLAIGVIFEDVGSVFNAGGVNVLYGGAGGLTGVGSQFFTPDTPGVPSSAEALDNFGLALAAGDFDHDGSADLAIGSLEDVGAIDTAGAVTVLYGSTAGLTSAGSQRFTQDTPGVGSTAETSDAFGAALTAGDFNHDGFADLAVGAPLEDVGGDVLAGAVNVLYGSAGGLTGVGSQYFTQDSRGVGSSAESGDFFGSALTAGDFDLDGSADLAIGAPREDVGGGFEVGAVNVLYGSAGGLTGTGSHYFTQDSPGVGSSAEGGDLFGAALATGDFNLDGFADLAVGAPGETIGAAFDAGAVNVLDGSAGGLTGTGSQYLTQNTAGVPSGAEEEDFFGAALAASGSGSAAAAASSSGSQSGARSMKLRR